MTTSLEERVSRTLRGAAESFCAPPGLRAEVDAAVARSRRLRVRATASVVVTMAVVLVALAVTVDGNRRERVAIGPPATREAWVSDVNPVIGWRFEYPSTWAVEHYAGQCRIEQSGTVVSNSSAPGFLSAPGTCTTERNLTGIRQTFVGVEITHYFGGPPVAGPVLPETPLPLALEDGSPVEGSPVPQSTIHVVVKGDTRYQVRVWIGTAASEQDRHNVARIVASLRPTGSVNRLHRR